MLRSLFPLLLAAWVGGCAHSALAQSGPEQSGTADMKNGEYVFHAAGCASCHAAPASGKCDSNRTKNDLELVGGRCLKSDYGTFYVPNITPDKETGIGGWTLQNFIDAMTRGVSPSGENYYPSFPYASYQKMTRADLADLKAYLDTLPAVRSDVPEHELSFPYNIRAGLRVWKSLYLDGKTFEPDPQLSPKVNRGAYLVEALGHCGECHTPRGNLGGMLADKKLGGAPDPEGDGVTPNITPHETGIGSWSEKDIAFALETGLTPSGDTMSGTMSKVQANMAKLSKEDREAIAAYLKSVPPIAGAKPKT